MRKKYFLLQEFNDLLKKVHKYFYVDGITEVPFACLHPVLPG